MTIYLIGPRASGKTLVGARLAEIFHINFVDTDAWMLRRSGETVAEVVAKHGWEEFRRRESDALRGAAEAGGVIATGGGMVLAKENRDFMRENGVVLYLTAPLEVLAARLADDPENAKRPSLTGRSIIEELADILAVREPLYRETAHHILDASPDVDVVVERAAECIAQQ